MEIFNNIKGYEGRYKVSHKGTVVSLQRDVPVNLKQPKKDGKYKVVTLSKNGKTKQHYVHRLVVEHFNKEVPKGMAVNHIDADIYNNHIENLEIVSRRDNTYHGLQNKNHTSKYVGVHWNRAREKWVAMIRLGGRKKTYLGGFENELDAHHAVLNKLKEQNIKSLYA